VIKISWDVVDKIKYIKQNNQTFDVSLIVHLNITLHNDQLDAQILIHLL